MELVTIMNNAYHYQHTFNDEQAEEFREILSVPFDPLHLDGLELWLDAEDTGTITLDGEKLRSGMTNPHIPCITIAR